MLLSLARFDRVDLAEANVLLVKWGHKMGPLNRPFEPDCFALFHEEHPVCVVAHANLIAPHVGGGLSHITRENGIELARLCAGSPDYCRIGLRLWREMVFPQLGKEWAVSYQDAVLHSGNLYRFDGWTRAGFSSSGTDKRSGLKGRRKWIWLWKKKSNVTPPATKAVPVIAAPC